VEFRLCGGLASVMGLMQVNVASPGGA